ncbi:hypothetical protein SpiGrapes_1127 [Sphaerochaeta pleomorpha str. Grapes]|uniref:Uncharacterized protein n=1 Tax=Sphaerochaeta pleomorpha (strain ATCC BAA-1885 / DSM 22778 / Grapes) TaxID=158190 RepID=G8QS86_SPHPG|nr:hypothetical protein [Sphaerochaeta pleomorpha]AEV28947.1 hypothetical protein SpiGrapes_1127 [Sphaerochaeta pleomorpha str. Grapes]
MGNLQADILGKQKEIEGHRNDLFVLYADLGKTIATIEQVTPLGYCHDEFLAFQKLEVRSLEAEKAYERLHQFVSQLEDRSRKIKQIENDIKSLNIPAEKLFSRLGAIAYEAYGAETLADYLLEICSPFFEGHSQRTKGLEKAFFEAGKGITDTSPFVRSKAKLKAKVLSSLLESQRKKVLPQFAKAGAALVEVGCEADIPGLGTKSLVQEIAVFQKRQQDLMEELSIHRNAVAKMKDQEVDSPHRQLEQSKNQCIAYGKERDKVASVFGRALYETLPSDISSWTVGQKAISLIDQISLHLRRIAQLEKDILQLQNMMKVEELQAQIELDNQKVAHLNAQIDAANRQISQVQQNIEAKRQKITSMMPQKALDYHGE